MCSSRSPCYIAYSILTTHHVRYVDGELRIYSTPHYLLYIIIIIIITISPGKGSCRIPGCGRIIIVPTPLLPASYLTADIKKKHTEYTYLLSSLFRASSSPFFTLYIYYLWGHPPSPYWNTGRLSLSRPMRNNIGGCCSLSSGKYQKYSVPDTG